MQASAAGCEKPKYSDSTLPQTIICNTWIDVNNANQDQNPSPLVQYLPFIGQYGPVCIRSFIIVIHLKYLKCTENM